MKIEIETLEDLELLLNWRISQNHTHRWGAIRDKFNSTYSFMHEDKNEVLKWLSENWNSPLPIQ
jgi:hypothetical protein